MGYWGVKSYEDDDADDAIDMGFETVHGQTYESLMDDRSPKTYEQIQKELANPQTLAESIKALDQIFGHPIQDWNDEERLSYCGIVVRHAELGVTIPAPDLARTLEWLENEDLEWDADDQGNRNKRRAFEIDLLKRSGASEAVSSKE